MYVTSKIRHRVIPYLLGVLEEGPLKVNQLLDYLETQVTGHQRSTRYKVSVLFIRKELMRPGKNLTYTEESHIMSELFEAKGHIRPEVEWKISTLQGILADRLIIRTGISSGTIGPKDHIAFVKMVPSATALMLL